MFDYYFCGHHFYYLYGDEEKGTFMVDCIFWKYSQQYFWSLNLFKSLSHQQSWQGVHFLPFNSEGVVYALSYRVQQIWYYEASKVRSKNYTAFAFLSLGILTAGTQPFYLAEETWLPVSSIYLFEQSHLYITNFLLLPLPLPDHRCLLKLQCSMPDSHRGFQTWNRNPLYPLQALTYCMSHCCYSF